MWVWPLVLARLGAGWHQLLPGVGYYQYNPTPAIWREAQNWCVSQDSTLAVPTVPSRLGDLLVAHDHTYAHVGFHDIFQQGQYVTVFGELMNKTGPLKWELGAPLAGPSYNCGAISRKGELAVLECEEELPFICENKLWSEYEYFPGVGYYKLYTSGESWADARQRCEQDGAHLVVLGSEHEAGVLRGLLARFPTLNNTDHSDRALVGFHALYSTGPACPKIHTVLGQSLAYTGYTKWKRGQPKVATTWHCGGITREAELIMVSCSHKYAFICEHEL